MSMYSSQADTRWQQFWLHFNSPWLFGMCLCQVVYCSSLQSFNGFNCFLRELLNLSWSSYFCQAGCNPVTLSNDWSAQRNCCHLLQSAHFPSNILSYDRCTVQLRFLSHHVISFKVSLLLLIWSNKSLHHDINIKIISSSLDSNNPGRPLRLLHLEVMFLCSIQHFFSKRKTRPYLTQHVTQLLLFPLGRFPLHGWSNLYRRFRVWQPVWSSISLKGHMSHCCSSTCTGYPWPPHQTEVTTAYLQSDL